jgi:hypothetical protein
MTENALELVLEIAQISQPALWNYFEIDPESDGLVAINAYYAIQEILNRLEIPLPSLKIDIEDIYPLGLNGDYSESFQAVAKAIAVLEAFKSQNLNLTSKDIARFLEILTAQGYKLVKDTNSLSMDANFSGLSDT